MKQRSGGDNEGLLLPPLWDHHGHLHQLGAVSEELDLRSVGSAESLLLILEKEASRRGREEWILGFGWDHNLWKGEIPALHEIDKATDGHPLFIKRIDCHAALTNSAALSMTASRRPYRDHDEKRDTSRGSGPLVVDDEMDPLLKTIPPPGEKTIRRRLIKAFAILRSHFLSGATDMQLGNDEIEVLTGMDRAGTLDFPVLGYKELKKGEKLTGRLYRGKRFIIKGMKVFLDGALGSRGAALREPYSDDGENRGILLLDRKDILAVLKEANAKKFDLAFHSIGDRAFEEFLAAYELAGNLEVGVRIEHAQVTPADLFPRFQRTKVTVSLQPCHYLSDRSWARRRLGAERARNSYLLGSLIKGKDYLLGTDFPIESPDPRRTVAACLFQRRAEKIGLDQVLKGMACPQEFKKFGVKVKACGAEKSGRLTGDGVLSWRLVHDG